MDGLTHTKQLLNLLCIVYVKDWNRMQNAADLGRGGYFIDVKIAHVHVCYR